jgi:LCP family protein required for cell wall assembly
MMVTMPVLGIGGKQAGTAYGQLALSHTYGEGLQDSAENTRETISSLFNNINIDHYIAVNMDAICLVNDAVGGVTVNVVDDFSEVDPTIPQRKVTLRGLQALTYVRTRMDVGNQLNITRMSRHEEYMRGLLAALLVKSEESDRFIVELYDALSPYMVTDCTANTLSGLMQRCAEYTLKDIFSIEGQNVLGEEYYEFYADEEKLDDLMLKLFYAPK